MSWINNNKFDKQTNIGFPATFQVTDKFPLIDKRIFSTKEAVESFISNPTSSAIPGLILRVIEDDKVNNGAYLVEKNGETQLKLTKFVTGDISTYLKSSQISSNVPLDDSTLIILSTSDNNGSTFNSFIKINGNNYVKILGSSDNIIISASTATLADASNGLTGLAMAEDVYRELVNIEDIITTTQNQIANKVGLDSSFNLVWSEESGLTSDNIKDAVETILLNANSSISDINSSISIINSSISDIDSSILNINSSIKNISINALNDSLIVNNSSILFSSDTNYIHLSANDNKLLLNSRIITLANASNGSTGLSIAQDVYTELVTIEKVAAAAITVMAETLGMDNSLGVTWSEESGIPLGTNYKTAIELYRNYFAGLGLSLNDRIFSLNPATSSSIGGVKIADSSISGITLANDGSIGIVGPSVEEIITFLEED